MKNMRLLVLTSLALVLVACGGGGTKLDTSFQPAQYWLGYQLWNIATQRGDLHLARSNGTEDRLIDRPELLDAEWPTFSPDGKKLAYYKPTSPASAGLFVLDLDANTTTEILQMEWNQGASFGPIDWFRDGSKLLYIGVSGKLFSISADGTNNLRLTPDTLGVFDRYASWSPDGTKVVTKRVDGGPRGDLVTMNSDGTNQVTIAESFGSPYSFSDPDWVTNSMIVCVREGDPDGGITLMNSDGGGAVRFKITEQTTWPSQPKCSPDGKMIAFGVIFSESGPTYIGVIEVSTGKVFWWPRDGNRNNISWVDQP